MFESLEMAPRDPILGLTEAFRQDPNPEKINLSVGVYQDAAGQTPVLESVARAQQRLVRSELSKSYLPIDGLADYTRRVRDLLLGADHEAVTSGRAVTVQTPGGTGGLRVAGDFMGAQFPQARVWLSEPTWPNHPNIFRAAGLPIQSYAYFDAAANSLDFEGMLADLRQVAAGDVVVLHGCCHNPTGVDLSPQQWTSVGALLHERRALPLIDFAYQGFAEGLREDAAALRALCQRGREALVCSSMSKNFGLYRERTGALTIVATDAETAQRALSQVKRSVRANYSNPPAHGASVVATILGDDALRRLWESELAEMRQRIAEMRRLLIETLNDLGVPGDFSFIARQRGMFSFSGLTPEQVNRLREEHAVYIVGSGRINVAGITENNIQRLGEAIRTVVA